MASASSGSNSRWRLSSAIKVTLCSATRGFCDAVASSAAASSVAHPRRADFRALGMALQNGDLAGAQSAFADLAKLLQSNGQPTVTAASGR
jgi:hypothetical protein